MRTKTILWNRSHDCFNLTQKKSLRIMVGILTGDYRPNYHLGKLGFSAKIVCEESDKSPYPGTYFGPMSNTSCRKSHQELFVRGFIGEDRVLQDFSLYSELKFLALNVGRSSSSSSVSI